MDLGELELLHRHLHNVGKDKLKIYQVAERRATDIKAWGVDSDWGFAWMRRDGSSVRLNRKNMGACALPKPIFVLEDVDGQMAWALFCDLERHK
jgi:hypothetical protein